MTVFVSIGFRVHEPAGRHFPYLAFLWPAFAAASASETAALAAKQFADFAVGPAGSLTHEPKWATPHKIALELATATLREFSVDAGETPVLLCLPLALHGGNAAKVLSAARTGDRCVGERPYSSTAIVFAHSPRSDVITATIRSRSSPKKLLAAKICLISSRSPSGRSAICFLSMLRMRS